MAIVTGKTAEAMEEIADASVVSGEVVGGNLILTTRGGTDMDAGSVVGPEGPSANLVVSATAPSSPSVGTLWVDLS